MSRPKRVSLTRRSGIPSEVKEVVISRQANGSVITRCQHNGHIVGERHYELMMEVPMRGGKRHGDVVMFYSHGQVCSISPYRNGIQHGVARQYSRDGRLVGTYRMRNGTGIDLWWHDDGEGTWYLSEICSYLQGRPHGCEQWFNPDHRTVYEERYWFNGDPHGIERSWSPKGRLGRGYPRCFVRGKRVTMREYAKLAAGDPTLPPIRPQDNRPQRVFPKIKA